jgi:hypothetical protein
MHATCGRGTVRDQTRKECACLRSPDVQVSHTESCCLTIPIPAVRYVTHHPACRASLDHAKENNLKAERSTMALPGCLQLPQIGIDKFSPGSCDRQCRERRRRTSTVRTRALDHESCQSCEQARRSRLDRTSNRFGVGLSTGTSRFCLSAITKRVKNSQK